MAKGGSLLITQMYFSQSFAADGQHVFDVD
jgi:hypothetical protein